MQKKLQCSSTNVLVPYISIYKKRSNFLVALPNSLNGTAGVSSTYEVISEKAETVIQQSILQELEKTESEITHGPGGRENQFEQSEISSEEKVKDYR